MCGVSSLYGDQAITGILKSCKDCGKVLWEIQFEFKIQIDMDHSNMLHSRRVVKLPCQTPNSYLIRPSAPVLSHPDSRSDPNGGSEPSPGRETIY